MLQSSELPAHYTEVREPSYSGRGNHSVTQLEDIAEAYKELTHQLKIRLQFVRAESKSLAKALESCESDLFNQIEERFGIKKVSDYQSIEQARIALYNYKK